MRHFRSFCHIIDYVTLWLYDIFLVSQTRHTKEVKQYIFSITGSLAKSLNANYVLNLES
jgi:hypothetical protein